MHFDVNVGGTEEHLATSSHPLPENDPTSRKAPAAPGISSICAEMGKHRPEVNTDMVKSLDRQDQCQPTPSHQISS